MTKAGEKVIRGLREAIDIQAAETVEIEYDEADNEAPAQPLMQAKRSVIVDMSRKYGIEPDMFVRVMRATILPSACTDEQFAAFLMVAKEYNLNPLTKEIFAFTARGGGIVPVVSVDGWIKIIQGHDSMDGLTFEDALGETGDLISVTANIFRKDRKHAVSVTEYMAECQRGTDTWKQWPRRMLRHKATIQAARYAFGFSGIFDLDEAERMPVGAGIGGAIPDNSSQAKKKNVWPEYEEKIKGFTDLNALEEWWASAETIRQIQLMPKRWQEPAQELYERMQETLAEKLREEIDNERARDAIIESLNQDD